MSSSTRADEFDAVARVVARSILGRAVALVVGRLRAAARASAAAAIVRYAAILSPAGRLRLVGVAILAAVIAQEVVAGLVRPQVAPAMPALLRIEILILVTVLVPAASHIVRAWPGSRARALIRFLRASPSRPPLPRNPAAA